MAALMTGKSVAGVSNPKFIRRRLSDGAWWNTSGTPAFEAYNAANIATYGIAGAETGSTGVYTATDPAETTAGDYWFIAAAGASLVVSDVANNVYWQDAAGPQSANVMQLLGTAWLTPATAGTPDVNVKLISGDATAADNAEAFFDGTGYAGTNNVIPLVTTTTTATNVTTVNGLAANVITAASIATGAIDADAIAADAVAKIQNGLAIAATALSSATWTNARAGYLDNINVGGAVASAANLATVAGYLDTEIAAILEDTGATLPAQIAALSIPTAAANAAAWGASVVGNSRTRDMYLQGLSNKIAFAADGLTYTLYASDDTTVLFSGTATRLATSVGGLRSVDPT
jgi:hypothetical protein